MYGRVTPSQQPVAVRARSPNAAHFLILHRPTPSPGGNHDQDPSSKKAPPVCDPEKQIIFGPLSGLLRTGGSQNKKLGVQRFLGDIF